MYADYKYYSEQYHGAGITEAAVYEAVASRASEFIDWITFDRIPPLMGHGKLEGWILQKVMCCCCALADAIVEYQLFGTAGSSGGAAGAGGTHAKGIKSETQHNYQIQYQTAYDSLSSLLHAGETLIDYLKSICSRYLSHTGLLFRGVECNVYEHSHHNCF